MKAAVCTNYGNPEVLKLKDVEKPTPKEDQILLKIHSSSVTSGDARIRRADPYAIRFIFGFKRPRKSVLGVVVAGEVESLGSKVSKFKIGDKVFGTTGMSFGAHAQYQCIAYVILPRRSWFVPFASVIACSNYVTQFKMSGI